MNNSRYNEAFNQSVRYLSYKSRSEREIIDYLKEKDYDDEIIIKVIQRLKEIQYIDDDQFTIHYVNSAIINKKKGRESVIRELLDKGIDESIIMKYLPLYTIEVESDLAIEIAQKYFYTKKEQPLNMTKTKLYNKLIRKGFSGESIRLALNELDNNEEILKEIEQQENNYRMEIINLTEKYKNKYFAKENNMMKIKNKIYLLLVRKGFDRKIINDILDKEFK